jgi:hypothetical protein
MKKTLEFGTKAERRALKKRPSMAVHGRSLKGPSKFGGLALAKNRKKRK